jgi:hypothetical protein
MTPDNRSLRLSGFRFTFDATVPLRLGVEHRAGAFDVLTSLESNPRADPDPRARKPRP